MGYISLKAALTDLERSGQLVRISEEVDPVIEMAAIHRRAHAMQGPAILFEKVKNSKFPAVSNIFGTNERVDFLFRKEIPLIRELARVRNDPKYLLKHLGSLPGLALHGRFGLQKKVRNSPLLANQCKLSDLPAVKSWPMDGGRFVTMPMVISEDPDHPGIRKANIGMYRIQLDGNDYLPDKEAGLHYQIHRGIGVHHRKYKERGQPFRISVGIGGPPAHSMAAILPLPEGMSESIFAGLLNSSRYPWISKDGYLMDASADFVITGTVDPDAVKDEGPFGDHLGYYSLKHPFPVLHVDKVYHRPDAIWHFTVVGRPPAEDSGFGYMIHKLFDETLKTEFPGLIKAHAVDAAGVHPLLLATGKERYMPFRDPRPEEILTIANRLLGSGQTSLAKYLWITADPAGNVPDIYDIKGFFRYMLERLHFERDLHFITHTTIDTLDYSGTGLNAGSKLILAAYSEPVRVLKNELSANLILPDWLNDPHWYQPGMLVLRASQFDNYENAKKQITAFCEINKNTLHGIAMIVLADDAKFTALNDNNFVWVTFTRSDPARDIYGANERYTFKHWSIDAPLIIDARKKPHHAPELIPDADIENKIDRFFTTKGPFAKWL